VILINNPSFYDEDVTARSCPPMANKMGKVTGADYSLVNFFRLVVPLQSVVMGSYPIRSVWFPNHLPLERTELCSDFSELNRQPVIPGVQDPNKTTSLSKHLM
jgi:hypothetical protein